MLTAAVFLAPVHRKAVHICSWLTLFGE